MFRWGLPYRRALCIFSPQLPPQYLVSLAMGLKINVYPLYDIIPVETEVDGIICLLSPRMV